MKKTMEVEKIEKGTVIDHIPPGKGDDIRNLLKLSKIQIQHILACNLKSVRLGKKDIIKIIGLELSINEINIISIIAPNATISIIKDWRVYQKIQVKIPQEIKGLLECPNENCICNDDDWTETKFKVSVKNGHIYIKCHFCERQYLATEAKIIELI